MTVNYFIECPICKTITRMRSPAGYIYSTPVRIHCGNCNTLLTGEFISDEKRTKAYFIGKNCKEVQQQDYSYYGETSGEILSKKIVPFNGTKEHLFHPTPSPVFDNFSLMDLNEMESFIDYSCYVSNLSSKWDKEYIKYSLYLNSKYDLIRENYSNNAKLCGYKLDTDFGVLKYIYYSLFFDCAGIFKSSVLRTNFFDANNHFRHLNRNAIFDYVNYLESSDRLNSAQEKVFGIFFDFIKIFDYIIPALGSTFYIDSSKIDKKIKGISTCTFEDVKHFYQNAFEVLSEYSDIVVGLDNIEIRDSFNIFTNSFDMDKFVKSQRKGNRIKFLDKNEFFSGLFDLAGDSNELRNAIGHNDYRYDGIIQEISYTYKDEDKKAYLLDVCVECVKLMKSAYILAFYIYELLRYKHRVSDESITLNPLFYVKTNGQDRCPCGSGRKYRSCCKSAIESTKKNFNKKTYPIRANTFIKGDDFLKKFNIIYKSIK